MNTRDFKPFLISWPEIFVKQKELKFMYEPSAKELYENFDLDCFEDQELFKKYCWRIVEELAEALEADQDHLDFPAKEEHKQHIEEELIDSLNFAIELMILCDFKPAWIGSDKISTALVKPKKYSPGDFLEIIKYLGLTANCLKNRQWRQSQYIVDILTFGKQFEKFIRCLYHLLFIVFNTDANIRKAWSLKYQVNLFRIKSNY